MPQVQVITKDDAAEAAEQAAAAFASVDDQEVKQEKVQDKTSEKAELDTKIADAAAAKAAVEDEWAGVPVKVRQTLEAISGKVGSIDELSHIVKSQDGRVGAALRNIAELKTALEAAKTVTKAGGDAPSQEQIAAASASDQEWEKLLEDFPEWNKGIDKRIEHKVEARLSKLALPQAVDVAGLKTELTGTVSEIVAKVTSEAKAEARELAKIDRKYENWETDIYIEGDRSKGFTPEFKGWVTAQAPEVKALGASQRSADAIKMLDVFYEHRKAVAEATAKADRNKKRLSAAITPRGEATPGHVTISDRDAAEIAFASVDHE